MSTKVDFSDPQVKKAVYSMYRNILGTYNDKANGIVGALPKERVREDQGVSRQLESMIRQSNQISGGTPGPMAPTGPPGPPPPPPLGATGTIPSLRIQSEISPRKEPPAAIQNAMMTKDKKPFTYTPGGIDLAEIRSPRMQKRINRNAHTEDSCSPQQPKPSQVPQIDPQSLPPSVVAAMQPQIAIPVFPPGGPPPPPMPSHPPPPPPMSEGGERSFPPPPPPPFPGGAPPSTGPPPPPPPPFPGSAPPPPLDAPMGPGGRPPPFLADIQNRPALRPVSQPPMGAKPPIDYVSEIPNRAPLRPVHFGSKAVQEPPPSPIQNQVQLKPSSPRTIPEPKDFQQDTAPQPPSKQTLQSKPSKSQASPLYIPPPVSEPPKTSSSQPTPVRQTPPSPAAMNKSPAPWMTSQKQGPKETPPWANRDSQVRSENVVTSERTVKEESHTTSMQGQTRIIPIQIEGREPPQVSQASQSQLHTTFQTLSMNQESQGRTRIIPIQIEGANETYQPQGQQQFSNNQTRTGVQNRFQPGTPQTPTGSSSGNYQDSQQRQFQSQVSWTPGNSTPPIQSRSFRVLQKITGSEDGEEGDSRMYFVPAGNGMQPGQTYLVNRVFPRQDSSPQQYMGDNVASWSPQTRTMGPENNGRPDESEY